MPTSDDRKHRLGELARLFLRLGLTAFGGPAAHVAMMQDEIVRRRGWMTQEKFLDLLAAAHLIPGPNSTEMAIHVGRERAGWRGLLVAGGCFILPACLITLALAWAYVHFGSLPQTARALYGVKPVIIAVVVQALAALARVAVKTRTLAALALVATAASFAGMNELLLLLLAGVAAAVLKLASERPRTSPRLTALFPWSMTSVAASSAALPAGASAFGLAPLFLFLLKVGAILFGSGYVLLAFLRAELVGRWHWLSEAQLLDAIAVGQITPGPVFSTAPFIGYLLGRTPGAAVATLGIFLPGFCFVAASGPLVPRLRRSPTAGAFLDGVIVASLALMAEVTWHLGRAAIVDWATAALAAIAAFVLFRYRPNSAWLVLAGALAGLALGWRAWA